MVVGVHTVLCQVTDMTKSVEFYRGILERAPEVESPYWTHFRLGAIAIGLHPPFAQTRTPGDGWILGLEVDDIRSFGELAASLGAQVGKPHDIPGGVVIEFSDPDENRIQATQIGIRVADLS